VTQHSKDRPPPPTRDEGERISLSDINELDAEEIQAVPSHSSAPPPPPKEALTHVVVPRLAPLKSDSLRPPQVPASGPDAAPASGPEADPEMEITETPRRPVRAKKHDDDADDRDVVDIRWVLAAAVLLAVVIGTWTLARRGEQPAAAAPATGHARVPLTLTGVPSGARVELDGQPVTGTEVMVRSGIRHAVEISADGHRAWRQVFITRGGLELVVNLEPEGTATAEQPVVEAPPAEVPAAEEPRDEEPAEAPRLTQTPSTRPSTSESTASSMSTTSSASSDTTSTMSSTATMTATMRSTHTLVRDPGF